MTTNSCFITEYSDLVVVDLPGEKSGRVVREIFVEHVSNHWRPSDFRPTVTRKPKGKQNTMIKSIFGVICAAALLSTLAHAQTSSTTTTAPSSGEMTGTIKQYTPGSLLVLETLTPNEPVQFKLSKNVTYADTDGKTIEAAGLTTNRKVHVHYTKVGADNVADKVTLIGN